MHATETQSSELCSSAVTVAAPTAESAEYESALTLSATTTVKAIAVKDGVASAVASKTFTKSEGGDDEPGGDDH